MTFGDKTVEYRSVDELQAAIREVKRDSSSRPWTGLLAGRAAPDPGHHGRGSDMAMV